jgi:hypothetical protein
MILDFLYSLLVPLAAIATGLLLLYLFAWALVTIERKRDDRKFTNEGGVIGKPTRAERLREKQAS